MKKALMLLLSGLMLASLSGCPAPGNTDANGNPTTLQGYIDKIECVLDKNTNDANKAALNLIKTQFEALKLIPGADAQAKEAWDKMPESTKKIFTEAGC